jgi:aspartate aminotransferase
MSILLSNRINELAESETLAMSRISRELKAEGHDVITLGVGEPDFYTPDPVKAAAKKAIDDNFSFYPPVNGYLDFRQAISEKLKRDNNLDYTPDQIVVSTGAKHSIMNVLLCLINPGDEVIIPTPYWVSYSHMVTFAQGKQVFIEGSIENDFKITPQQLEASITPQTKLFMFSSPCNPSGSVYTKKELADLAAVFEKHPHVYILSDEIYELINFEKNHESIAQFDTLKDRVILINGVSKGFAMTGWRIGYMASHKDLAVAAAKLQGQFTSAASSIAQKAALQAMKMDPAETYPMLEKFKERRDMMVDLLRDIPGVKVNIPQGAFYLFPDVSSYYGKSDGKTTIQGSADLCNYILYKVYVALVPGDAFGAPNCLRISYATSNELLIEAMKRVKSALAELK